MGLLERCSLLLLDYILLMLVQTSSFPMKICHGGTSWHNTGRFLVHCSPCWWCGGSLPLGMAQSNAHLGDSPLARASHCIMRTNLYTRGFFNVHQSKHGTTTCTRIFFYNLQKQSSQEPRSLHQQLSSDHQTNNFT